METSYECGDGGVGKKKQNKTKQNLGVGEIAGRKETRGV
jgi:hypothetical protein